MMNSRAIIALSAVLILGAACQTFAQPWQVKYGSEKGHVAVCNSKTDPKFSEDAPYGPMSFRVVQGQLWLLDSIGGKLLCLDEKNEVKSELAIQGLASNVLLEDFAIVAGSSGKPETVWIADAADCMIRKISLANGKELLRIGGNGAVAGKFLQINQLEVDRGGRLYVGDYGRNLISVFTQYGELIREIPWENCGFAINSKGSLVLLAYRENAGYFRRTYSQKGQLESNTHLGMSELQNPRIWGITANGSLVVSFIPAGGFKGNLNLYELADTTQVSQRAELVPPGSMNRFLSFSDERLFLAEADFFSAPAGNFSVRSFNWDGKK